MRFILSLTVAASLLVFSSACTAYTFIEAGIESNFLVDNDHLFFSQSDDSLTVLKLSTGEVLRRDKSRNFSGTLFLASNGIVVVGYSAVTLLDRNDFKVLWRVEPAYNSIVTNDLLVSDNGNGLVQCRNLVTERLNWSYDLPGAVEFVVDKEEVFINRAAMFDETA